MKKAFSLIELVAVMFIIGILIILLLPAIEKAWHGKNLRTVKQFYTLTRDISQADDLSNVDLSMLEKPEVEKPTILIAKSTNTVLKLEDYVDIKVEKLTKLPTGGDGMAFTFTMKKPFYSLRSFVTVSQNVVRIEYHN
jgi:prepilin-type N-terminal cleavage/methylation domain-containing protein